MSTGGGGQSTQRVIQEGNTDPWSGQQPHLRDVFSTAQGLSGNPLSFFPGQTFAGLSGETEGALGLQTARALGGNAAQNAANTELTKTLSGNYLSSGNPHFNAMADRIKASVLPAIDSRFAAGGRAGGGLHGRAIGEGMTDALGSLAYQNFDDERTRMMQGMAFAPTLAAADYTDIAKLGEVGGVREDLTQQGINEAMARHQFGEMEPWQRLGLYQNAIQGNYGGSTSSTGTQFLPRRNLGSSLFGGALSGAGLGGMVGGPVGAGIGGLLGLGLGLFN